jgi:diamine N-acetyltransferase
VNVQLIPATKTDIFQIHDLAVLIWNQHYPSIISQEQIDFMLQNNYNAEALTKQMQEGQQFFLIQSINETIGFLAISEKNAGSWFMHKLYINTQRHRSNAGTEAFKEILNLFPQIKEMRLQVNRQNYKAINFYFKMGFTIDYIADFDIGNGYFMNDFVMKWESRLL